MSESSSNDGTRRDFTGRGGNTQVQQLFARLTQEIEEKSPANVIFFIVDFLCKHYPRNLTGFASIWNGGNISHRRFVLIPIWSDPELERDRLQVVEFFRFQKLPTEIASQFTSAGFDTVSFPSISISIFALSSVGDIVYYNS